MTRLLRIVTFVLLFAAPSLALAQGCGSTNPNCIVATRPAGDSTNAAASTAFVQGAIATPPGAIDLTGGPSLGVLPIGNPITTYVNFAIQSFTTHATNREFAAMIGMTSNTGTGQGMGGAADKVALYTGMVCNTGTIACWSVNPLTTLNGTLSNDLWAANTNESDFNNNSSLSFGAYSGALRTSPAATVAAAGSWTTSSTVITTAANPGGTAAGMTVYDATIQQTIGTELTYVGTTLTLNAAAAFASSGAADILVFNPTSCPSGGVCYVGNTILGGISLNNADYGLLVANYILNTSLPGYSRGVVVATAGVEAFEDESSAATSYAIYGLHNIGIDMSGATFSNGVGSFLIRGPTCTTIPSLPYCFYVDYNSNLTAASAVLGLPTGGNKGVGTLNVAGGFYLNGVLQLSNSSLLATANTWTAAQTMTPSTGVPALNIGTGFGSIGLINIGAGNAGLLEIQTMTGTPAADSNRFVITNRGGGSNVQQTGWDIIQEQGNLNAGAGCTYAVDCATDGGNTLVTQFSFNGPTGSNTNRNYTSNSPRIAINGTDGGSSTTLAANATSGNTTINVASAGSGATAFQDGDTIVITDNNGNPVYEVISAGGAAGCPAACGITPSYPAAAATATSGNAVNVYRGEMDAINPTLTTPGVATNANIFLGSDYTDSFTQGNALFHGIISLYNTGSKHGDLIDASLLFGAAQSSAGSNNLMFVQHHGTEALPVAAGGYILKTENNPIYAWTAPNGISLAGPQIAGNVFEFQTGATGSSINNFWTGAGALTVSGIAKSAGLTETAAAPTVSASQIGFGGTVAATGNCGSLAGDTGCIVINVAGTTRYVPYY